MNILFLVASFILGPQVEAAVPERFYDLPCRKEIERTLTKAGSKDKWVRTVDPQKDVQAYRSRTKEFAKWVEVQSFENPYLFVYETSKTRVYQWDKSNCSVLINSDTKPMNILKRNNNSFTDKSLQALLTAGKRAMIYIWSPTMVYSMKEMHVFKKVAESLGLEFIPVLEFYSSIEEAKKIFASYKLIIPYQKLNSLELYMREGTIHFPISFIVANKRISSRIFGAMSEIELTQAVAKELADLQQEER